MPKSVSSAVAPLSLVSVSQDPDGPIEPALDFMRTVWALNHAVEVTSKQMESEFGLTIQQRMILRFIGKYPGLTAGTMATLLRVHKATVSAALKRLESRRLLRRVRDPADQRRVTLTLTARGRALDVPNTGTVESATEHLLRVSSARDLRAAQRVMRTMIEALEDRR